MKGDSTGVSPVIATILLIAITVVAVGVVMAFVAGIGRPVTPVATMLTVENAINGSDNIRIFHMSGDSLTNASANVELRVNGVNIALAGLTAGAEFKVGDMMYAAADLNLVTGDVISIIYKPTNQTILTLTVS
jgi:flagellin-like protein